MGFTGFYWVLLGLNGFEWVSLGLNGFYWVLLGFTGFYWVLLDFIGFYWTGTRMSNEKMCGWADGRTGGWADGRAPTARIRRVSYPPPLLHQEATVIHSFIHSFIAPSPSLHHSTSGPKFRSVSLYCIANVFIGPSCFPLVCFFWADQCRVDWRLR